MATSRSTTTTKCRRRLTAEAAASRAAASLARRPETRPCPPARPCRPAGSRLPAAAPRTSSRYSAALRPYSHRRPFTTRVLVRKKKNNVYTDLRFWFFPCSPYHSGPFRGRHLGQNFPQLIKRLRAPRSG